MNLRLFRIFRSFNLVPEATHSDILAMKAVGGKIVSAEENPTVILMFEERVMRHHVGHRRTVVPDIRQVAQSIHGLTDWPIGKATSTMGKYPSNSGIALLRILF